MSTKEFLDYNIIKFGEVSIQVKGVLFAIIFLFIAWLAQKILKRVFKRLGDKKVIDEGSSHSLYKIAQYILWVIIIILTLETIGIKVSIIIAGITALLFGIGLGLQQLVTDLVSGIILLVEQNLKVNDIIELEDGTVGRVTNIGIRTSRIITRMDITMIIPNSYFANGKVINWSIMNKKTIFKIKVAVKYGSDIHLVKNVLIECAKKHEQVSQTPEPTVFFKDFGDSGLHFELFYNSTENFAAERIKSEIRFFIDDAFNRNNIVIPFPQRDIHLYKNP